MNTEDMIFVGLSTFDICYELEDLPQRNQKAKASTSWTSPGGPAFNAAVTFCKLGGQATLYTSLPTSPYSSSLHDLAESSGLEIIDCAEVGAKLPIASIIVHPSNGDRTVIGHREQAMTAKEITSPTTQRRLFWDGYYEALFVSILRAAEVESLVYDGGSWKEHDAVALDAISEPVVSERFYVDPRGRNWCEKKVADGRKVIVTRGNDPVQIIGSRGLSEIAVPEVKSVDTLGAGDVFHGAYCFARFCDGMDHTGAAVFAAAVASFACTRRTPHDWTHAEAVEFYQAWLKALNT